jgi:transcription antitermination factor NusG
VADFERDWNRPKIGDQVIVDKGPFQGLNGVFEKKLSGQQRVAILLETIGYQAHVLVEERQVTLAEFS